MPRILALWIPLNPPHAFGNPLFLTSKKSEQKKDAPHPLGTGPSVPTLGSRICPICGWRTAPVYPEQAAEGCVSRDGGADFLRTAPQRTHDPLPCLLYCRVMLGRWTEAARKISRIPGG